MCFHVHVSPIFVDLISSNLTLNFFDDDCCRQVDVGDNQIGPVPRATSKNCRLDDENGMKKMKYCENLIKRTYINLLRIMISA